ncbi:MAG: mechanosensitive ion channel [Deltaproteobacteria bacterium]|nr:mechanosensitive ion channel [Deltaproteobacteria bacterium]
MPPWLYEIWIQLKPHLPTVGVALLILIGGWFAALIARGLTFAALKRTSIDDKIAAALGVDTGEEEDYKVERAVSRVVYYIAMAFVLVAFLERLHIKAVTTPIVTALDGLGRAVPGLLKAALIGFIGFGLAMLVKKLLLKLFDKSKVIGKLGKMAGHDDDEQSKATGKLVATIAFWFIVVMAAIPTLEALQIGALAEPLKAALAVVSTYLPKVIGAALLLVAGYVLGRLARAVIGKVIDKSGLDKGLKRIGLEKLLGTTTVGSILGTLAMAFVMLHFAISAVGRLDIQEISEPLGLILQQLYGYLPKVVVGGLLLAVGVLVARLVARASRAILAGIGFNALLVHIGVASEMSKAAKEQQEESEKTLEAGVKKAQGDDETEGPDVEAVLASGSAFRTPSDIAGSIIGALVVVVFLRQVLSTLGLEGLAQMVDTLLGYLPNVLVAAVVVAAGMWAGRWARARIDELTKGSKDQLMRSLGAVVHVAVVTVASMVALQQLGVGAQLIGIAFGLVLGAVCLALALAFGLGGRDTAAQIVKKQYTKSQR